MAKRKSSIAEDLTRFFISVPWWVGPIFCGSTYVLLRFVVPAIVQGVFGEAATPGAAAMNVTLSRTFFSMAVAVAPWGAGLVGVVWLFSLVGKWERQRLLVQTGNIEKLRSMSWQEFERLVAQYYRQQGYQVEERGGASPDGGIDIIVSKGGTKTLVQCKHWRAFKIGIAPVRELLGVMTHSEAAAGILVTSGQFTTEARTFADDNPIDLVDGSSLMQMIRSVQPAEQKISGQLEPTSKPEALQPTPACPKCGAPMAIRTARTGPNAGSKFYGCTKFPACRGIRNPILE